MHALIVWLQDPAHRALELTVAGLALSEIMPFLPTKANGIAQALLGLISKAKASADARTKQ